ncbi:MAG: histidine kinase [Bacteroidetes bacterium]|nr:histidine kinase [Bacteroidota bacterium]
MRQQIKRLSGSKIIVHAVFILAAWAVLMLLFKYYFGNVGNGIAREECISILYFLICVYAGRWICKTWFIKSKFVTFTVFCIIGFIVLLYAGKFILNELLTLNQKNIDEFFFAITPLFIAGMLAGIFVPMIKELLHRQILDSKKIAEQKQGELNLLLSQLSPHFLFNTLNNLYGISLTQHEKIPNLLLKLSELLRYSVYETSQPFIPVREEVKYINNYISFEKIRIGERLNLKTDVGEADGNEIKIAPMLLIVFIENAFKHSKNSFDKNIFIDIRLKIIDENIMFTVSNSYNSLKEDNNITKDGGLGLENVKKRLELLYTDEYSLNEESSNNLYSVTLQLKAK